MREKIPTTLNKQAVFPAPDSTFRQSIPEIYFSVNIGESAFCLALFQALGSSKGM